MIVTNGYISFSFVESEGGLDENGFPIDEVRRETTPIKCQWRHVNQNLRASIQGSDFELAEYEVIIPIDESVKGLEAATLTLDDEERTNLISVKIKSIEHLRLVRKTKIYL